ncbi:MAG: carbon-nitrogen hydrolase family protein [Defluviitaleaceae bacterium]|nr:carbon-nitrogen hydrolase family protein [Defluviitaleaceae bacterium]
MSIIKIAAVQSMVYMDKKDTLDGIKCLFENDKVMDADIVTLPEFFNCPLKPDLFRGLAEPEGGETWQFCSQLAKAHGVYLSAGSIPELDENGRILNTAYVFDRSGKEIAKYSKIHMFDINVPGGQYFMESDTVTPGSEIVTFDTEFGKMGLCICYDMRFPELHRLMALEGVIAIIVPAAFNMTTGPAHWEILFRTRAHENGLFYIGTSPARDINGPYVSWANSIITGPWGEIIAQADETECVFTANLDIEHQKKIRQAMPILTHRRNDVYKLERG